MPDPALLALLLVLALTFDFLNGFHDAANVVATIIASRALPPRRALLLAAAGDFAGPLLFGVAVATTVGRELVEPGAVTITVVLAALVAASLWNVATWWFGIPSSSSHALAGGLVGAAVAFGGWVQLRAAGLLKIAVALFASPIVGFVLAWVVLRLVFVLARRATPRVNRLFNRLQLVTATALSLSHGSNDAQKTMGIITLGLVTLGYRETFSVPLWVVLAAAAAIALGTASGGWRIIRTLGGAFYRVRPVHSLSAQASSAAVILAASLAGGPVSTTHVAGAAVVGAGASQRLGQVRWGRLRPIALAWMVTVPATTVAGAGIYALLRPLLGE
jgi:PiT family inorganic phosphate transporter